MCGACCAGRRDGFRASNNVCRSRRNPGAAGSCTEGTPGDRPGLRARGVVSYNASRGGRRRARILRIAPDFDGRVGGGSPTHNCWTRRRGKIDSGGRRARGTRAHVAPREWGPSWSWYTQRPPRAESALKRTRSNVAHHTREGAGAGDGHRYT